jgi:hypothetical protein
MPPYRLPYRMTPTERDEYQKQIASFKDKSYIRESESPFAAPVLFVPKTQLDTNKKKLRLVIDYGALYAITTKDKF